MKNENKKKGLFARLIGEKKSKKSSCCSSFEIEEIPEDNKNENKSLKKESNSCCK